MQRGRERRVFYSYVSLLQSTSYPAAQYSSVTASTLFPLDSIFQFRHSTNTTSRPHDQRPDEFLPKLFGPLRLRYANRPGGYTRVLRTEPLDRDKKHKTDDREYNPGQPESAILELVDGPRDMRFAITARALVRQREREEQGTGNGLSEIMATNIRKVTRFREGGEEVLEREVRRLEGEGRRRDARRGEGREDGEDEERDGDVVEKTSQGNDLLKRRR